MSHQLHCSSPSAVTRAQAGQVASCCCHHHPAVPAHCCIPNEQGGGGQRCSLGGIVVIALRLFPRRGSLHPVQRHPPLPWHHASKQAKAAAPHAVAIVLIPPSSGGSEQRGIVIALLQQQNVTEQRSVPAAGGGCKGSVAQPPAAQAAQLQPQTSLLCAQLHAAPVAGQQRGATAARGGDAAAKGQGGRASHAGQAIKAPVLQPGNAGIHCRARPSDVKARAAGRQIGPKGPPPIAAHVSAGAQGEG